MSGDMACAGVTSALSLSAPGSSRPLLCPGTSPGIGLEYFYCNQYTESLVSMGINQQSVNWIYCGRGNFSIKS